MLCTFRWNDAAFAPDRAHELAFSRLRGKSPRVAFWPNTFDTMPRPNTATLSPHFSARRAPCLAATPAASATREKKKPRRLSSCRPRRRPACHHCRRRPSRLPRRPPRPPHSAFRPAPLTAGSPTVLSGRRNPSSSGPRRPGSSPPSRPPPPLASDGALRKIRQQRRFGGGRSSDLEPSVEETGSCTAPICASCFQSE